MEIVGKRKEKKNFVSSFKPTFFFAPLARLSYEEQNMQKNRMMGKYVR